MSKTTGKYLGYGTCLRGGTIRCDGKHNRIWRPNPRGGISLLTLEQATRRILTVMYRAMYSGQPISTSSVSNKTPSQTVRNEAIRAQHRAGMSAADLAKAYTTNSIAREDLLHIRPDLKREIAALDDVDIAKIAAAH